MGDSPEAASPVEATCIACGCSNDSADNGCDMVAAFEVEDVKDVDKCSQKDGGNVLMC